MNSQKENAGAAPPERPSFFSIPPRMRFWGQVGARFWGGVLIGVGVGIFLAGILAEFEVINLGPDRWTPRVSAIVIAFILTGMLVTQRSASPGQQPQQEKPRD